MKTINLALAALLLSLLSGCALITTPVKVAGTATSTAIKTTGTVASTPFKMAGDSESDE
jgi:hypothetical protein